MRHVVIDGRHRVRSSKRPTRSHPAQTARWSRWRPRPSADRTCISTTGTSRSATASPSATNSSARLSKSGPSVRRFRPGDRVLDRISDWLRALRRLCDRGPCHLRRGPQGVRLGVVGWRAGIDGRRTVGRLPAAAHPGRNRRRGSPAAHRQPQHRMDRRQAGGYPRRRHGRRAGPRGRRALRGAVGVGSRRRPGAWGRPGRRPAGASRRVWGGRRSRVRRWTPSWKPPADEGPRRSSTPSHSTPRSLRLSRASGPGGTVSVVGVHNLEPYPLPILIGLFRSLTVRMTTAPVHQTWKELVPLIVNGRLRTDGVFTHRFPLAAAPQAYAAAAARSADCIKVMMRP